MSWRLEQCWCSSEITRYSNRMPRRLCSLMPTKSCKPSKSCMSCLDSECSKGGRQAPRFSFWYLNPRMETGEVLVAVSELNDTSHRSVRVPRGMWNETGAGVERSLRFPVEVVLRNARTTGTNVFFFC